MFAGSLSDVGDCSLAAMSANYTLDNMEVVEDEEGIQFHTIKHQKTVFGYVNEWSFKFTYPKKPSSDA